MSVNVIILVYLVFVFLPFLAAFVIFSVFARKKIRADRAAGILPPKKKKKPSVIRRLWQYYLDKQASVRK